jgi:glycosyltransferase involved in cell wall biosynthesis
MTAEDIKRIGSGAHPMVDLEAPRSEAPRARAFSAKAKYKILQSCSSRSWGGLEMQALLECTQLKARGHDVTLLCTPKSRLEEEANRAHIETLSLELRASTYPMALGAIRRFLTREGSEIIHAQISQDLPALVGAAVFIPASPPIVLTKRVGSFISKRDPFHRWLYRHVSLVVAISEVIRRNIIDTCPIDAKRVVTLFDGVDLERFNPSRVNSTALRRDLGLSEFDVVIGMVGRFSPGKGHEEFLEAAGMIHSKLPEIKFLVVGEPSYGEQEYGKKVRERARALAAEGVVIFTGFRADIPEVMAALDILAFPSHAEAFGDVLIEAMAMNLPVVSTNCDGVLDIVIDGETGIQIPPRDARALANALMQLIHDEQLRRTLGESGRRRVEKIFDLKRRTETMERLYAWVLSRMPNSAVPVECVSAKSVA